MIYHFELLPVSCDSVCKILKTKEIENSSDLKTKQQKQNNKICVEQNER